jgi:hypothetical protein
MVVGVRKSTGQAQLLAGLVTELILECNNAIVGCECSSGGARIFFFFDFSRMGRSERCGRRHMLLP